MISLMAQLCLRIVKRPSYLVVLLVVLDYRDVRKNFGTFVALNGVSMRVHKREVVCPNRTARRWRP